MSQLLGRGTLGDGVAPVKAEYFGRAETAPLAGAATLSPAAQPRDAEQRQNKKRNKRKKGQNKKRRRGNGALQAPDRRATQLCRGVAVNQRCDHGDTCPYSHDAMSFWKAKAADIGAVCPNFTAHGHCPFGMMCRYAGHHTTLVVGEDGAEALVFAQSGETTQRCHLEQNQLVHTLQRHLRKHTYPFTSSSSRFKTKKEKEKKQEQIAADAAALSQSTVGIGPGACVQITLRPDGGALPAAAATAAALASTPAVGALAMPEKRPLDLAGKVYIAPLTTVGNLPYRCVMKGFGADITCSEMAVATNLLKGQSSEWALLRRHPCEDCFGLQVAGSRADVMTRCAEFLEKENFSFDFIDLNAGCPIDCITGRGAGSALMTRPKRLESIVRGMASQLTVPVTVKIRAGWSESKMNAPALCAAMQSWGPGVLGAVSVHGRTRAARYTKAANWGLIRQCGTGQSDAIPRLPVVGNGDVFSWEHWAEALDGPGGLATCMLARGALIKPWLPTEIKERRCVVLFCAASFRARALPCAQPKHAPSLLGKTLEVTVITFRGESFSQFDLLPPP